MNHKNYIIYKNINIIPNCIIFSDRVTSPGNVWANCITTVIIEHLSREDLFTPDELGGENLEEVSVTGPSLCAVNFETNIAVEIEEEKEEKEEKLY